MAARKVYFETTRVGDELPAVAKAPIDRVQLAKYASATGDFNALFLDDGAARAVGMPSVMVPTTLAMGFLGQLVGDWARGAFIKRLSCRFSRMLWPGDSLICKGRVADRHGQDGAYFLELDVWAENQKGELVAKAAATVKVFYSPDDEYRARSGQAPIVINVKRQSILVAPPINKPQPPAAKLARSTRRARVAKPGRRPVAKKVKSMKSKRK